RERNVTGVQTCALPTSGHGGTMSAVLRRSRKAPAKDGPAARRDIPPGMRPPPLEPMRNPGLSRARLLDMHRFLRLNRVLEDKLRSEEHTSELQSRFDLV